jgi:hypothetical protein
MQMTTQRWHRIAIVLASALACVTAKAQSTPDTLKIRSETGYAADAPEQNRIRAWLLGHVVQDVTPATAVGDGALGAVRVAYDIAVDPRHPPDLKTYGPVPPAGMEGNTLDIESCGGNTLRIWSYRTSQGEWQQRGFETRAADCAAR